MCGKCWYAYYYLGDCLPLYSGQKTFEFHHRSGFCLSYIISAHYSKLNDFISLSIFLSPITSSISVSVFNFCWIQSFVFFVFISLALYWIILIKRSNVMCMFASKHAQVMYLKIFCNPGRVLLNSCPLWNVVSVFRLSGSEKTYPCVYSHCL